MHVVREQTRALAIMPNNFDQVAAAAPKNVEITGMRITLQALLDQPRKAWKAAPHIGVAGRKPHPHITRNGNHRRSSTSRTRASASGSTCASTRMRCRLPRSISINPICAATTDRPRLSPAGKSFGVSSASVAAICTGAKDGMTCSDVRACRRQVNTRLLPAQNLDPHRLMTLKLDLRSHAWRITACQTRQRPPDAYLTSTTASAATRRR